MIINIGLQWEMVCQVSQDDVGREAQLVLLGAADEYQIYQVLNIKGLVESWIIWFNVYELKNMDWILKFKSLFMG